MSEEQITSQDMDWIKYDTALSKEFTKISKSIASRQAKKAKFLNYLIDNRYISFTKVLEGVTINKFLTEDSFNREVEPYMITSDQKKWNLDSMLDDYYTLALGKLYMASKGKPDYPTSLAFVEYEYYNRDKKKDNISEIIDKITPTPASKKSKGSNYPWIVKNGEFYFSPSDFKQAITKGEHPFYAFSEGTAISVLKGEMSSVVVNDKSKFRDVFHDLIDIGLDFRIKDRKIVHSGLKQMLTFTKVDILLPENKIGSILNSEQEIERPSLSGPIFK